MNRRESPARSPIRKQLVKKIVSYYSQLDEERHSSPTHSPSRTKNSTSKGLKQSPKHKYMVEKKLETYEDTLHRNAKLGRLEDLMNLELERGYDDQAVVHPKEQMMKSVKGYPEFMKEKEDRLKYKEL